MIKKMKTIRNLFKQDKEKFVPPKGVQDCIPIRTIYKDGIFEASKNKYSKCFRKYFKIMIRWFIWEE